MLIVSWLLLAVAAIALGERQATLPDLRSGIASGDVTQVRIIGEGHGTVEVEWRDGLLRHRAAVRERRPGKGGDPTVRVTRDGTSVIRGGVTDLLRADRPDLRIEQAAYVNSYSSFLGWRSPVWVGSTTLGLYLLTLLLLAGGSEPWRATRWAWFWLIFLAPPLGIPAFLVLSGHSPLGRPRQPQRRLTGGWAFLLALCLSAGVMAG